MDEHAMQPPPAAGETMLFLSPHLDDAVYSCGELLASHSGATVVTIFAGRPPSQTALTDWDRRCGFNAGDDVVGRRRAEDHAALALLDAHPLWLDFLDSQYRAGEPTERDAIAEVIDQLLCQRRWTALFFPLGLFHSDHTVVHEAVLALSDRHPQIARYAYEDALYRTLEGLRAQRLHTLAAAGFVSRRRDFSFAPDASERKARAVACYRSQLSGLSTAGRLGSADASAPEGYWELMKD